MGGIFKKPDNSAAKEAARQQREAELEKVRKQKEEQLKNRKSNEGGKNLASLVNFNQQSGGRSFFTPTGG